MRKIIAAINMTLDGICDHTAVAPDEAVHRHYAELLRGAGAILYGRITYQLMEYWRPIARNPTGNKATDDFAVMMDRVPKIVFSRTLQSTGWESARLATRGLDEEVAALKAEPGKDIFVGSPGLIRSLLGLPLLDELQLCMHPVVAGSGTPLFDAQTAGAAFSLAGTKVFDSGAVICYYRPKS
jgi:dihydrofolate reductase